MTTSITVIRWLIRNDLDDVMAIELASFAEPWAREDIHVALAQRNCIGCVYDVDQEIRGYMLYELQPGSLNIDNIAVHPDYRRQGIATALVQRLKDKLSQDRRTHITTMVSEHNTAAQLWLRACGFRCIRVHRAHFGQSHDGYEFVYSLRMTRDEH
jgi:ribosomal-protein-alanine N-acetyltransferase